MLQEYKMEGPEMARKERGHKKPGYVCFKDAKTTPEKLRRRAKVSEEIKEGKRRKREEVEVNSV